MREESKWKEQKRDAKSDCNTDKTAKMESSIELCSVHEATLFLAVRKDPLPLRVTLPINCPLRFRLKWLSEVKLKAQSDASRQKLKFQLRNAQLF